MEPIILGAGALALWALSRRGKEAPTPKVPSATVSPTPSVVPAPTPAAKLAESQRLAQERRLAEERETQRRAQERQQRTQRLAQERQQRTQRLAQERQQQLERRKAQLRSSRPAPTPVPRVVPARAMAKFSSGATVLVRGETPWKIQERRYNERSNEWEYFFYSGWAWLPERVLGPVPPRPSRTPFPVTARDKWIGKLFVLIPKDNPLPARSEVVISDRFHMAINWVNEKMGRRLAFDSNPIYLTMPFTSAEVRRQASKGGNLPKLIFDWMQNETPHKPRGSWIGSRNEAWVVIVRGAGGYAGGSARGSSAEDVGVAMVGDAVLSSWLAEKGLERNICPDVIFLDNPYNSRLPSCTADAQTGAFVHEIFHACFGITPHESRSILAEWSWWWTIGILPKHKTQALASGYLW